MIHGRPDLLVDIPANGGSLIRIAHQGPSNVSFPFLRDYAPQFTGKIHTIS
jgi:hypothetical protein